jgi:hypothetical protein
MVYLIAMAYSQARYFKAHKADGKSIDHNVFLVIHALVAAGLILLFNHGLPKKWNWLIVPALILVWAVFFSPLLNILRNKAVFYINPEGKSKIDKFYKTEQRYMKFWIGYCVSFVLMQIIL